jgi:hypothetical protein
MTTRNLQLANIFLLTCWFGAAVALWPSLPDSIPMHFGGSGAADAWAEKSLFSWFGLPFMGLVLALMMLGLSRMRVGGSMDMWNVPEKERFLQLGPEQRATLMERLKRIPLTCGLLTTVLLASVHLGIYQVATGRSEGLPWYCMAVIGLSIVLILAIALLETQRFGAEVRRMSGA